VRVHGYNETVSEKDHCRMVSGVVAYVDPTTGDAYMLVIHQAIEIPSIKVDLLSPMQMRDNDLHVNDKPKHMALSPTEDHHCIRIELDGSDERTLGEPTAIDPRGNIIFPNKTANTTRMVYSEVAMQLDLISEAIEWDPSRDLFAKQEAAMLDSNGKLIGKNKVDWSTKCIVSALSTFPQDSQPFDGFGKALKASAL
jgi:hypothetical protein